MWLGNLVAPKEGDKYCRKGECGLDIFWNDLTGELHQVLKHYTLDKIYAIRQKRMCPMNRIYMDNCVTSQPAPEVLKAMKPYLEEKFWFPGSFISTGEAINSALEGFRKTIALPLNAKANEIHFTSGGTLANNLAIKALPLHIRTKEITSSVRWSIILIYSPMQPFLENSGFEVTYINADSEGFIDLAELEAAIRPETILFMTTIVNHVLGTIQPMDRIKAILDNADHKIYYHADAGQAFGKIPLDVSILGVDTMAISAHKIHAPQGIGALYVKEWHQTRADNSWREKDR
jgi:cysteine desulfurase